MCSIARPSALAFDAAAFPDRRRGVAAVAPAVRGVMARESSAARTQKRARDSLDGKAAVKEGSAAGEASVVPALPEQQRLQERMRAELDAVRALHRKAVLLCRGGAGAAPAAKGDARLSAATEPRREAPSEAAAKRRKTSPTKPAAEAAHRIKPVKQQQQQQPPSKRAAAAPPLPERKIEKKKTKEEVEERRRQMEELAREREEFRRLVLAMEKAALPDETVYPRDLEELGIFEYAVTRTRSQALSQDRILVGVAY